MIELIFDMVIGASALIGALFIYQKLFAPKNKKDPVEEFRSKRHIKCFHSAFVGVLGSRYWGNRDFI